MKKVFFLLLISLNLTLKPIEAKQAYESEVSNDITLVTNDGEKFRVPRNLYSKYSKLIDAALEDDRETKVIELSQVNSRTFKEINELLNEIEGLNQNPRTQRFPKLNIRTVAGRLFLNNYTAAQLRDLLKTIHYLDINILSQVIAEHIYILKETSPEKYEEIAGLLGRVTLRELERHRPTRDEMVELVDDVPGRS